MKHIQHKNVIITGKNLNASPNLLLQNAIKTTTIISMKFFSKIGCTKDDIFMIVIAATIYIKNAFRLASILPIKVLGAKKAIKNIDIITRFLSKLITVEVERNTKNIAADFIAPY